MPPDTDSLPLWAAIPFAVLILAIAVLPLFVSAWWEAHSRKALVTVTLSAPVAIYLLVHSPQALMHAMGEYGSFVIMLFSLFVVAGGIHVRGDLVATPRMNVMWLLFGAVLANILGTTGASMLLIRVFLRSNRQRRRTQHLTPFFILIVANCGGLLSPLGDPPLFLGYLQGVPFTWTLRLWPYWVASLVYLLAVFHVIDVAAYKKERLHDRALDVVQSEPVSVRGKVHILLLGIVVGSSLLPAPYRELGMLLSTCASLFLTDRAPRRANGFSLHPIWEVAILFAGIFVTMVPALEILRAHAPSLGVREPWQFFLVTGGLSSVLDNAPTYLSFVSTARGLGLAPEVIGIPHLHLIAISVAAVWMGANTYIGNGPNFMVKAIAEEQGVSMPSFFGYAWRATLVMTPLYVLASVALAR